MRTFVTLNNFTSSEAKKTIVRNLNRILDIVVLDIDIEHSTITLLHSSQAALEKVKRELHSIGFPIKSLQIQNGTNSSAGIANLMD